jgi:hypothetical protein
MRTLASKDAAVATSLDTGSVTEQYTSEISQQVHNPIVRAATLFGCGYHSGIPLDRLGGDRCGLLGSQVDGEGGVQELAIGALHSFERQTQLRLIGSEQYLKSRAAPGRRVSRIEVARGTFGKGLEVPETSVVRIATDRSEENLAGSRSVAIPVGGETVGEQRIRSGLSFDWRPVPLREIMRRHDLQGRSQLAPRQNLAFIEVPDRNVHVTLQQRENVAGSVTELPLSRPKASEKRSHLG